MNDERSERERRVVASLIDPSTRAAAEDATKRHGLTERHFSNAQWRDNFEVLAKSGADVFKGKLGGGPACDVSIDDPDELEAAVRRIVADYQPPCIDAAKWLGEPDEPDNPLISELIECGSLVAIVGPAKAAKSWLALILCVCIATGRDFYGRATTRRRVYYGNIEVSAKQAKKRLRSICKGMNIDVGELAGWLFIDNQRGTTATWERCRNIAREVGANVVIIDPFYQVFKGEERNEADCLLAVEEMKKFLAVGFTLFVVFHAPKGYSGDRQIVDMISGSSILVRFPENVVAILPHATEKDARVIDCSVLRDYAAPDPFCVRFENGTLALAPDLQPILKGQGKNQQPKTTKQKQDEQADENRRVREAFFTAAMEVADEAGAELLDARTFQNRLIEKKGGAVAKNTRSAKFADLWNEAIAEGKGILRAQRKQERKPNGTVGNTKTPTILVSTPERIAAYLEQFNTLGL